MSRQSGPRAARRSAWGRLRRGSSRPTIHLIDAGDRADTPAAAGTTTACGRVDSPRLTWRAIGSSIGPSTHFALELEVPMTNRRGRRAGRNWLILPPLALGLPRHWSASSTGGTSSDIEDHGLQALFELTADPVLVLDQSHIILDANRAAARYLTRHTGPLRGVSVLEVD